MHAFIHSFIHSRIHFIHSLMRKKGGAPPMPSHLHTPITAGGREPPSKTAQQCLRIKEADTRKINKIEIPFKMPTNPSSETDEQYVNLSSETDDIYICTYPLRATEGGRHSADVGVYQPVIHIYAHTPIYANTHTYTCTYTCPRINLCICTHMQTNNTYTHMHTHANTKP